jgi:methylation protein EvaC
MTQPFPCRLCNANTYPFLSFGQMPIANGFLAPEEYSKEFFFELKVVYCESCVMVQIADGVDPEKMFHDHYAFFSSTSNRMAKHFEQFAKDMIQNQMQDQHPFIIELGSNDGILLQHMANAKIHHLGIEPSANVAEVARQKGVQTLECFFDEKAARSILEKEGQADVILGANVMCHIPDLNAVARGAQILLKKGGALIFEDPYLGDIIKKTSYDQIYDEHFFYFSLLSVQRLFSKHGMCIFDAEPQTVHGGTMRYFIAREGERIVSDRVKKFMQNERDLGLDQLKTFENFGDRVHQSKNDLMDLLNQLKTDGKRVVAYGATSKSTTVTNFCGITPEHIEFISDTTPIKQGKFSPGAHIPIRPYDAFSQKYPEYALLFAWNHADEIMDKESDFKKSGGKWIVYVPTVEVASP